MRFNPVPPFHYHRYQGSLLLYSLYGFMKIRSFSLESCGSAGPVSSPSSLLTFLTIILLPGCWFQQTPRCTMLPGLPVLQVRPADAHGLTYQLRQSDSNKPAITIVSNMHTDRGSCRQPCRVRTDCMNYIG